MHFISIFIIVFIVVFVFLIKQRGKKFYNDATERLKSLHNGRKVFLCSYSYTWPGNHIMLSGAPFGTSINTGMKIVGLDGKEYEIKEIYIGHGNVTKPSLSVEDGAEFAILIIDAGDWNLEKSRRAIKKEKVIALELK